jgi:hypothetical protein
MPQLGVTTRLPLDGKEGTWACARDNQHQATLCPTERDVKDANLARCCSNLVSCAACLSIRLSALLGSLHHPTKHVGLLNRIVKRVMRMTPG